jgi:phosphoribosylaminoimidazole carboxylase (NCAIR synthetase)
MTAMAARSMGYDVRVLDPDAECSAKAVASHTITAAWNDAAAAATLGRHSDVVTIEIEQIPLTSLEAVANETRLHPGPNAIFVIQDRARQKEWLRAESFPLGDFRTVHSEAECIAAIATLGAALEKRAMALARAITERLGIVGLLAVEMFVLETGELLVNELAPRPHNTYHHSERASATSQFEQLVRAICGLPLGSTETIAPGAIYNLLGDLWVDGKTPDFATALAVKGVRLHLYGKSSARAGRKMGHLSAVGTSGDDALRRVQEAYACLDAGETAR